MEADFICLNCKKLPNSVYECLDCGAPYCSNCCLYSKIKCKECNCYEFQISVFGNMAINEIEVSCPKCKKGLSKNNLANHMATECSSVELKCLFKNCDKTFSKKDMTMHLINSHESEIIDYFEGEGKQLSQVGLSVKPSLNLSTSNFPDSSDFVWYSGSKVFVHGESKMFTFTSKNAKSGYWKARVFIKKCQNPGYMVIGIFNKYFVEPKGYLGGDLGAGNWGLAGNGACGECGKWTFKKKYNEGDIVEIIYNRGLITYGINGELDTSYSFKFGTDSSVYLAATSYYAGTTFIILDM